MRIMLAGALCGVPDKCDGIYSRPLHQRGADYPLAPFSQPTLAFSHFADCYRFAVSFRRTNAWYSSYQRLVFAVPTFGIRRTNVWYSPYQTLIPGRHHKLTDFIVSKY